jgi:hypothetical protein
MPPEPGRRSCRRSSMAGALTPAAAPPRASTRASYAMPRLSTPRPRAASARSSEPGGCDRACRHAGPRPGTATVRVDCSARHTPAVSIRGPLARRRGARS